MEEAEYLCDRVAIMDSGKLLKIDAPRKLIEEVSNYYQLSFFTNDQIDKNIFDGVVAAKNVFLELPKVVIELSETSGFNEVLEVLHKNNISHSFLTLKSATLEDVYLRLTGRELIE
jgi:ABC-2 type transport system ATP-binding protein